MCYDRIGGGGGGLGPQELRNRPHDPVQDGVVSIERLQCHPGKSGGHVFWCPEFCYRL